MAAPARIPTIGETIKRHREQLGIRAEDLASKARLSVSTVRRIESGADMNVATLSAIAEALETTVGALVDKGAAA